MVSGISDGFHLSRRQLSWTTQKPENMSADLRAVHTAGDGALGSACLSPFHILEVKMPTRHSFV